mmetsp:Transcript_1345/g.5840  ORF Transcript_1345/g.5840 Transcript_1345/m.5840 type:complete len:211 (-) Transcript_1345:202-834(-)
MSRCRFIIGPTDTCAPHPFGHSLGLTRHWDPCAESLRNDPRHLHPKFANVQFTSLFSHVVLWCGMSRSMQLKPQTPPTSPLAPSLDMLIAARGSPFSLPISSSSSSSFSSSSISHRSHISGLNSHVSPCLSRSRSGKANEHAVSSKSSNLTNTSTALLPSRRLILAAAAASSSSRSTSSSSSCCASLSPSACLHSTFRSPNFTSLRSSGR